jgi:hypothetical protein
VTVSVEKLKINPVAIWLENAIDLDKDKEILFRWKPKQIPQIALELSKASGEALEKCQVFLEQIL